MVLQVDRANALSRLLWTNYRYVVAGGHSSKRRRSRHGVGRSNGTAVPIDALNGATVDDQKMLFPSHAITLLGWHAPQDVAGLSGHAKLAGRTGECKDIIEEPARTILVGGD